ncbi:MAG: Smr/MutS family protein, partial [bacterium]|nr:Smr/MutS family protein [bacterium]
EREEKLAGRESRLSAQQAQIAAREAEIGMNEAALVRERWAGEMTRRREAEALMKEIRREADLLLRDMRSAHDPQGAREVARDRIRDLTERLDAVIPAPPEDRESDAARDFRIGEWVRLRNLNRQGQVEAVHGGGMLSVAMDGKSLRVPAAEVLPSAKPAVLLVPKAVVSGDVAVRGDDFSLELHLRGRRAEEALELLDKYLDDAAVLGVHRVRVVHGKGSGVLKSAIADHLEKHLLVASFGPAADTEGGWGVTNVELAG